MNHAPNILFLAHRVPYPPNRGDRIRSWHMLRFLAERANVHLACLTEEPVERPSLDALHRVCQRVHVEPLSNPGRWVKGAASLLTGRSATEGLFAARGLQRVVDRWSQERTFDAVLVFCSSMFQFAKGEHLHLKTARLVVDLVDVDSEKWHNYADSAPLWKRPLYRLEARRVRQLEQRIVQRADAVTLVSEEEAAVLRRFCNAGNIHAVGNGVDLEYFHPPVEESQPQSAIRNPQSLALVFVGVLDYRANLEGLRWFCHQVWPLVRQRIPRATLSLVGRRPGDAARRLAATPGVELVGEVADVRPHVWNADAVIAPLQVARGIQNKILEALAMGKPVVATPQAIAGTSARDGEHLLAATTPEHWADALAELAANAEFRTTLGQAGRSLIERDYHWPARLEPLTALLNLRAPVPQPQPATELVPA